MHHAPEPCTLRAHTGAAARRLRLLALLVAARANDGLVAPSGRRESAGGSRGNGVSKCHLDAAGEFCIALSGDAVAAAHVLNQLARRRISSADVFKKLEGMAAGVHSARRLSSVVAGHLTVAQNGGIGLHTVSINHGIALFTPNDEPMPAEGDCGATALCRNPAQDMALEDMSCEAAARYLHTLASRIAETVKGAGGRGRYGIDMAIFTVAGDARLLKRRTDKMGTIEVRFKEDGTGTRPGRNGAD